jgi:hypothetical protein
MPAARFAMMIEGAEELKAKLESLRLSEQRGVFTKALRVSQKLMQKMAKVFVMNMVGGTMGKSIAENIILRKFKKRRKYSAGVNVFTAPAWMAASTPGTTDDPTAPIYISKSTGRRQYIPAAIEYGHVIVARGNKGLSKRRREKIRKAGNSAGVKWVPPYPYMRKSSDMTTPERFRILSNFVAKYFEAVWAKKHRQAFESQAADYDTNMERSTGDEF